MIQMVLVAPCLKQGLTGLFNVWAPNAVTVFVLLCKQSPREVGFMLLCRQVPQTLGSGI